MRLIKNFLNNTKDKFLILNIYHLKNISINSKVLVQK
jgi:hypothetical protein